MREIERKLDGKGLRIGIVQSRFNPEVCEGLLGACRAQLVQQGVAEADITLATVPIALGAVIRGDTYHFEVVSNESARCVNEVQLACGVPVANAILTTDNDEQAIARMHVKGGEAALVAIEMANLLRDLA